MGGARNQIRAGLATVQSGQYHTNAELMSVARPTTCFLCIVDALRIMSHILNKKLMYQEEKVFHLYKIHYNHAYISEWCIYRHVQ